MNKQMMSVQHKIKANRRKKYRRAENKRKIATFGIICLLCVVAIICSKGNQPEIVGYTYDSGSTVWEMAKKHCPSSVDIRNVVREIEKLNEIENAVVYDYMSYKVPVYENSTREADYLDMNTIVGYDVSASGILLYTADGNGYYIEK